MVQYDVLSCSDDDLSYLGKTKRDVLSFFVFKLTAIR